MNKSFMRFAALIFALALPALGSAQEANRGFLFQLGLGAGFPSYPPALDSAMTLVESLPGVTRVKVALDFTLGYAVTQQAYILGRIDGVGDRVTKDSTYIQINTYLYAVGLRYYPMTEGLYIEAGAGSGRVVLQDSTGVSSTSDPGFGYGAAIGYDLAKGLRGSGLTLEAKYDGMTIKDEKTGAFMILANYCWK